MREIKFRAWDKEMGEMLQVGQITFAPNCDRFEQAYIMDENNDIRYLDDCEIMQYTGLEDKHGTPIFEGDIVQYDFVQNGNWVKGIIKGEVIFEGGMFVVDSCLFNLVDYDIEIIGNKWEGCKQNETNT